MKYNPSVPLVTFDSPSESDRTGAAACRRVCVQLPPLRFFSPSTSSRCQAATNPGGDQPPSTCPLSVSHALRAFLRPTPAGLVSCRSRPWGSRPPGSISTRRAVLPLGSRCPPGVDRLPDTSAPARGARTPGRRPSSPWTLHGATHRANSSSPGPCSLRASVSPARRFKPCRRPRPSWAFSSSGDSPSMPATLLGVGPLMGFVRRGAR